MIVKQSAGSSRQKDSGEASAASKPFSVTAEMKFLVNWTLLSLYLKAVASGK